MDVSFLVERLVAIGALLLASAFFAGSETALFSLSRVQREAMATREDRASRRLVGDAVASAAADRHHHRLQRAHQHHQLVAGGDAGGAGLPAACARSARW